jgi:hypothetical protein
MDMNLEPSLDLDMSHRQYQSVMGAITSLDAKFTASLATGLASLNTAILALTEAHHKAALEQERRNSTFATQAQVDHIARSMDQFFTEAGGREARIRALENQIGRHEVLASSAAEREARLAALERRLAQDADHSFALSNSVIGYLVTALTTGFAVTVAFLLAHAAGVH